MAWSRLQADAIHAHLNTQHVQPLSSIFISTYPVFRKLFWWDLSKNGWLFALADFMYKSEAFDTQNSTEEIGHKKYLVVRKCQPSCKGKFFRRKSELILFDLLICLFWFFLNSKDDMNFFTPGVVKTLEVITSLFIKNFLLPTNLSSTYFSSYTVFEIYPLFPLRNLML